MKLQKRSWITPFLSTFYLMYLQIEAELNWHTKVCWRQGIDHPKNHLARQQEKNQNTLEARLIISTWYASIDYHFLPQCFGIFYVDLWIWLVTNFLSIFIRSHYQDLNLESQNYHRDSSRIPRNAYPDPNFNDLDSYDRSSRNNPRHQPSNHLSYVPVDSGKGKRISRIAHENGE